MLAEKHESGLETAKMTAEAKANPKPAGRRQRAEISSARIGLPDADQRQGSAGGLNGF